MTLESLKNYYRDKIDDIDDSALDGKSFEYKKKIVNTRKTTNNLEIQEMQTKCRSHYRM